MVEQIDEISEVLAALRSLAFFYLILKVDEVVTCLFQLLLYQGKLLLTLLLGADHVQFQILILLFIPLSR